uniref:Uncharacterized protein n=1 Tax=Panagrolaimus sp. JU765 TaxID=591449 RepID=A0AC34Q153_9BILA
MSGCAYAVVKRNHQKLRYEQAQFELSNGILMMFTQDGTEVCRSPAQDVHGRSYQGHVLLFHTEGPEMNVAIEYDIYLPTDELVQLLHPLLLN